MIINYANTLNRSEEKNVNLSFIINDFKLKFKYLMIDYVCNKYYSKNTTYPNKE